VLLKNWLNISMELVTAVLGDHGQTPKHFGGADRIGCIRTELTIACLSSAYLGDNPSRTAVFFTFVDSGAQLSMPQACTTTLIIRIQTQSQLIQFFSNGNNNYTGSLN
jgi:hypothetical protein